MAIISLSPGLLKIATSTQDEWDITTTIIPEGVVCYSTDTGNAKVGDGTNLYTNLDYAFDAIPEDIRTLIDGGTLVYTDENDLIPTSYFPKDVFNIHVVVADIATRDALSIDVIKNSILVLVLDASGDPTVTSSLATYVAKFTDDTTYTWIKTGEGESLDLDLSQFLLKDTVTLDDINDSDTYKRLTPEELATAETALQDTDVYTLSLESYDYWINPKDSYMTTFISGYNENGIVDDLGTIPTSEFPTANAAYITTDVLRNNRSTIRITPSNRLFINSVGYFDDSVPWSVELSVYFTTFTRAYIFGIAAAARNTAVSLSYNSISMLRRNGPSRVEDNYSFTDRIITATNTWYDVRLTQENHTYKVYINNTLQHTQYYENTNMTNTRGLMFGSYTLIDATSFYTMTGYIQDIKLYRGIAAEY